jgi:FAD:protein FMN transferase
MLHKVFWWNREFSVELYPAAGILGLVSEPSRFAFIAMGSECVLHLDDANAATAHAAELEVLRIEHRYSRYRADSVLSQINRVAATGGALEVDDETAALIDYAFACYRKSDGLFDITTGILRRAWNFSSGRVPAPAEIEQWLPFVGLDKIHWDAPRLSFPTAGVELDFGGIGKEYAADRAAAVCIGAGVTHGLVDLGGDLCVIGPRSDDTPWPIHIRDPRTPGQALAHVSLAVGGLATSGDYERCVVIDGQRYGHILNPHTGWPMRGLAGVSVVADTCLLAGSISTIAMLKGAGGVAWLDQLGVRCVWIDTEGRTGGSLL